MKQIVLTFEGDMAEELERRADAANQNPATYVEDLIKSQQMSQKPGTNEARSKQDGEDITPALRRYFELCVEHGVDPDDKAGRCVYGVDFPAISGIEPDSLVARALEIGGRKRAEEKSYDDILWEALVEKFGLDDE